MKPSSEFITIQIKKPTKDTLENLEAVLGFIFIFTVVFFIGYFIGHYRGWDSGYAEGTKDQTCKTNSRISDLVGNWPGTISPDGQWIDFPNSRELHSRESRIQAEKILDRFLKEHASSGRTFPLGVYIPYDDV